jgi:hypothetical protein
VLVVRTGDVQAATADIVDSFIVDKEGTVRVLNCAVGGENCIIGFYDRGRHTRRRVHGELKLALLAVVGRKALEEQSTETGTSTTTERVEDEEALERRAVVCRR